MNLSKNQRAVLYTLAYSAVFEYPLSVSEVFARLIRLTQNAPSLHGVGEAISSLCKSEHVSLVENHLAGYSATQSLLEEHEQRRVNAEILRESAAPLVFFLGCLPWVKGVGITGSVAVNNATHSDDVDFLLIVSSGTLWFTRPLVVLFSFLQGKKRSRIGETQKSWCFNLWLEEDRLHIPKDAWSLYTAYEVCQVFWLFDADTVQRSFLESNSWVDTYLFNYRRVATLQRGARSRTSLQKYVSVLLMLTFPLVLVLNPILYVLQLWYMRSHRTREKVSYSSAFFHPRNTRGIISRRWKECILLLLKRQ